MAIRMLSTFEIEIPNHEDINEAIEYNAEGYDVFSVELAPGASDVELTLQPGVLADVHLFAIKANAYQESSVNVLSYKVHSTGNDPIVLDSMQMFNGVGAVSLLAAQPDKIYLSNSGAVAKTITVVIARDATP